MITLMLAWVTAAVVAVPATAKDTPPPNIIVILADDMGFSDLGCYGSEIPTPHLDRLAAGGLRFAHFYSAGRCCPTRASLLTGLYPHQSGVGHMHLDWNLPAYRGRLNESCVTLGEALRPAGYRTIIAGKWHVGQERGFWPLDRGFDRFYGSPQGGGHYFRMLAGRQLVLDGEEIPVPNDWFSTEAFTDHAIRFIRQSAGEDKPFFCYLAYFAPHYPLQARPDEIAPYLGKYRDGWAAARAARFRRQIEMGIVPPETRLSPPHPLVPEWETVEDREEMDRRMAIYAAQVSNIDRGVGRLVAELEKTSLLENTLLMFLSDNGGDGAGGPLGFTRGDRGNTIAFTGSPDSYASYGMAWSNVSNTPFRNYKGEIHEGGIATPLIVHWPARIRERGVIRQQVGHVIDLMPTCLEAAGAGYPEQRNGVPTVPLEGISLLPAFDGQPLKSRTFCWEHMGNRGVRCDHWKLVAFYGAPWELYNLETDPTEMNDLAAEDPIRVKQLVAEYDRWAERCDVETEEGRVVAILARAKDGSSRRISARVFVDSTGGVSLCRLVGCETMLGPEPKSRFGEPSAPDQPDKTLNAITLCYRIRRSDSPAREPAPESPLKGCGAHISAVPGGDLIINPLAMMPGVALIDLGYEETMARCQKIVHAHWHCLQRKPTFSAYEFDSHAPMLGVRESYRVVSEYVLTQHDLTATLEGHNHPDMIAVADHAMDVHGEGGRRVGGELKGSYGIPYRCLLPKQTTNLLVACRGAGFSQIAASSCRLNRTMLAIGHAAGLAAAQAVAKDLPVRNVDVEEIQRQLDLPLPAR
ncbi:MAG: sulfatase-like hydrolase/transferase [Thermoguttaceae bacterium]